MTKQIMFSPNLPKQTSRSNPLTPAVVSPTVDLLINDAVSIIGAELASYKRKIGLGARLDLKEAKIVRDYVEALCKLSKEAREISRAEDLSNLSNEELLQLATQLIGEKQPE